MGLGDVERGKDRGAASSMRMIIRWWKRDVKKKGGCSVTGVGGGRGRGLSVLTADRATRGAAASASSSRVCGALKMIIPYGAHVIFLKGQPREEGRALGPVFASRVASPQLALSCAAQSGTP